MRARPRRSGARRLALAVALVTTMACAGSPPTAAPATATPSTGTAAAATVADVKLELLRSAPADLSSSSRNPFQFQARVAQAPVGVRGPAGRRGTPLPVAPIGPAPAVVSGPPPLPAITLRYIGVADTDHGRVAMLKDPGGDILSGREGDIIDGRYRLLRVGPDSADLAYVDGRGRQTIRLSGQ